MVAVIDYDAGNIKSVLNAMEFLGQEAVLTGDPDIIRKADHVILPGVGAFGDAMQRIRSAHLDEVIRDVCAGGRPFLGICLGLQLLFEESMESPGVKGLGILKGRILRIPDKDAEIGCQLKVPQIGWNDLSYPGKAKDRGRLFEGIPEHSYVYFVHSYYLCADDPEIVKARTNYGVCIDASVESGNVFACQFHPEKSERTGMKILENFLRIH